MALALALLAAWAGIRGHRVAMWALCVLVLACKEAQVYTVGVIGLLMRVYGAPEVRNQWRFIVYLAGAWFLVGTGIVQQHIRNGGYTDFIYYRWLFGLDPSRAATLTNVVAAIFNPRALPMPAGIIARMFPLPLLAPRCLLLAIPPYPATALSGPDPRHLLFLHPVILPPLPPSPPLPASPLC